MKKRIVALFFVLLVAMVSIVGCGKKETTDVDAKLNTAKTINIAGSNVYFPLIIAKEKGFFEEELGSEIEVNVFLDFAGGPAMMEAMTAGDIDIANLGDMPTIQVKANNVDVKVISTLFTSTTGYSLIARNGSGINSLSDIKGKKIAVMAGSTYHKLLLRYLEDQGLTTEDIEIVFLKNADILSAFVGGNVDAAVSGVPTTTDIMEQTGATEIVNAQGYDNIVTVVAGRNDYLTQNPEVAQKYLKALIRANEWTTQNLDEAVKIVSEASGYSYEDAKLYYDTRKFDLSLKKEYQEALKDTITYLKDQASISKEIALEDLIDASYLQAIGVE